MDLDVTKNFKTLFILFLLSACVFLRPHEALAKEKQKSKSDQGDRNASFKVVVDLVTVNASVTDKKGNPVKDLTQDDFRILEEGVQQKISVFKIQAVPGVAVPVPAKNEPASEAQSIVPLARKVILFVDDYHLKWENLVRVKSAGEKLVRAGLGPDDLVALITASGRNSTELTKYREYVTANLNNITPFANRGSTSDCPPLSDYQSYEIALRQENAGDPYQVAVTDTIHCAGLEGLPNAAQAAGQMVVAVAGARSAEITDDSRRTLYALQTLARRLRAIEGPKVVMFLSDGMLTLDIQDQIQTAIDNAIRANTVIHTINAIGLDATPLGGDASRPSMGSFTTMALRSLLEMEERNAVQDAMNALASDTGGTYFHNNNDLFGQMKSSLDRAQITYILGYYPENTQRDGKFRKLVVRVNRPDVVVTARKGYYAPKGEEAFEAEKNADVKEALQNAQDFKDIPITVGYNITHPDASHAIVAVQTHIEVRKIHFQKRENRNRNIFTIVTVIYDSNDHYIEGRETRIDFNLTDPNYKNVMDEGLVAQASFRLAPGNYRVKAIVREAGETKLGSATKTLEISN
jgi:VWFA-related protein